MITFVCALKCEAESLIKHFDLKAFTQKSLYPIYGNGALFLIISGIGKMKAAAAVSYLYALLAEQCLSAWINIGVGGHPFHEVGKGFYAHQVIDRASRLAFYPTFTWKEKCSSETIYTVDSVEKEFIEPGIYEMEAAGFCSSAFCLTVAELIHCYKVISDNKDLPPLKDSHFVKELIASQLVSIEALVSHLQNIQREMKSWTAPQNSLAPFLERWRFTQTELFQLQRLIQRWEALCPSKAILNEQLFHCKKAKDVLKLLNQKLCSL